MQQQTAAEQRNPLTLDGVLEHVMRFMNQQERLGIAARVCSAWKAAAYAVSAEEGILVRRCTAVAEEWLQRHGAQLQALVVSSGRFTKRGITSMCQLTRLEASHVGSKPHLLQAIGGSLKALCHLRLQHMCWGPLISTDSRQELAAAANSLWAGCSWLTYVHIERCDFDDACVKSLCCSLTKLQDLNLCRNSLEDARSFSTLPPHLTSLILEGNSQSLDISVVLWRTNRTHRSGSGSGSNSAGECSWQGLRVLDLTDLSLRHPAALSVLTRLTWLGVDDVEMPELQDLLAALPHLVHLQQLNMTCEADRADVSALQLQRALQALTQLTALEINRLALDEGSQPQQQGGQQVWIQQPSQPQQQRLFAGLQFPQLQILGANWVSPWFTAEGLGHLVVACPRLCWLRLEESLSLQGPRDLQPLTALAATLTRLEIGDEGSNVEDLHMQSLAQLEHLVHLSITHVGSSLTDRGMCYLTALTAMTCLQLSVVLSEDISKEFLSSEPLLSKGAPQKTAVLLLTHVSKKGHVVASVSQQINKVCSKSPLLWKETQGELSGQLTAARTDAKAARKGAAAERKKASSAQQQARIAQQQEAAAKDEVTSLRQQLEALQAQQHAQTSDQQE